MTASDPPEAASGKAEYAAADLQQRLATDPRVAASGLVVTIAEGRVLVTGEWPGEDCQQAIAEVLGELAPHLPIDVQVTCVPMAPVDPGHTERVP